MNKYKIRNIDIEFNILNIGNIPQIANEIDNLIKNDKKIIYIGHIKLLDRSDICYINPIDFDLDNIKPSDTIIITNPVILKSIFKKYKYYINNISQLIKNQFIFLLPSFEKRDDIEVFWDNNFSDVEIENGVFKRWFSSRTKNKGKIYIYNHSERIKKIMLSFKIYTIDRYSHINISLKKCNNVHKYEKKIINNKLIEINNNIIEFNEEIYLYHGNNEINIKYFGERYIREDGDIRPILFSINDFNIQSEKNIFGMDAYSKKVKDSYLNYFMDDDNIIAKLHSKGFYDVISYSSIKDRNLIKQRYTRYFVCDLLYKDMEEIIPDDNNKIKLKLYNAKKCGLLNKFDDN
ncbi:MAG: hypothetical protein FWB86_07735 [Treponema sp.]|nr:hypothetical protein [Treponema sp.]